MAVITLIKRYKLADRIDVRLRFERTIQIKNSILLADTISGESGCYDCEDNHEWKHYQPRKKIDFFLGNAQ